MPGLDRRCPIARECTLPLPPRRQRLLHMTILAQLASDDVLDSAYEWLCQRRGDYSANADV